MRSSGLVNVRNDRRYDAFRGRIMFPIRNAKGLVIGFGARTMNGDEQPKYLNSPETPIYHKGSELYGYFEGREAIYGKGRAIVCEGYMDVIQLSQAGFEEAVAALGTSITPEHVRKLFKLTDSVYFSFDGDAAGRKAARRALEAALPVIHGRAEGGFHHSAARARSRQPHQGGGRGGVRAPD
ncbi:MAG: toprim domain-containing protein [Sutterella wadsworthensis]